MKRFVMLVFPAVLAACASAQPSKEQIAPETKPVVQNMKKSVRKTTKAYMADQEAELKQILKNSAGRITNQNNNLTMTFAGDVFFAENSYHPTAQASVLLQKIAPVLSAYNKTRISIAAYTNGAGKPSTNQLMSEKRAEAVALALKKAASISNARIWTEGHGNEKTNDDRSQDNRIVITLTPTFIR